MLDLLVFKDCRGYRGLLEIPAPKDHKDLKVILEVKVYKAIQGLREHREKRRFWNRWSSRFKRRYRKHGNTRNKRRFWDRWKSRNTRASW